MTEPRNSARSFVPDFLGELFRDPLDPGYADAAARREAAAADGRPQQPRRGGRLVSMVVLAVVGLLLTLAYQHVVAEQPARAQVRADLEAQIHERRGENEQLQQRADGLREEVAGLRDRQLGDPAAVRRLRELEASAGLGRVRGDGVVVEVDDGPPAVDPATGDPVVDPEARILYRDLQQIANALWAAGAEAVAINGHRLTATATIRSASGAILVDHTPVAGPYRVAALGPDDLADRFAASETAALLELLVQEYGVAYSLHEESDLRLPAAAEPRLRYATPVSD